MNKVVEIIAQELQIKQSQVESTIKLIDEGNTIPFIARYRKEVTGGLSDEVLRNLGERLTYLRNLESRKEEVIKSIDSQGKLTQEIIKDLENCITLAEVEDIYRPYKQKKRTRATIAKEKGLESLADAIIKQDESIDINKYAEGYINKEKEVNSVEDAINGALDIIAENISDNPEYRKKIKKICYREGIINTKSAKDEKSNYEMYYDFQEKVNRIPSHRILAINRGEKEEFLKVKIDKPEEKILELIQNDIIKNNKSQYAELLNNCIQDSFTRLIEPSIDREIRADLTEKAEEQAISVFGKNAKQLLLISPIKGKTVIGFDPAYRTGCKIAVIDETGKVLDYTTIYPTEPQNDIMGAKKELIRLILKDNVDMFAIGNGTASRESEQFVAELIQEIISICHSFRGRSISLFSIKTCNRRVSRYKCFDKRSNIYSKKIARSISRTCKNRSKGNRSRTISTRCKSKETRREFNRSCRRRCKFSWSRCKYSNTFAFVICCRG